MKNMLSALFLIFAAHILCWIKPSVSSTIGPQNYYAPVLVAKLLKPIADPDRWKKVQVLSTGFDGHTGRPDYHSKDPSVSYDQHIGYYTADPHSRPHIIKILHYPTTFKNDAINKLEDGKPNLSFYDLTGVHLTPELNVTLSKLFPLCPRLKEIISSAVPDDKRYDEVETESSKEYFDSTSTAFEGDETTTSYNFNEENEQEKRMPSNEEDSFSSVTTELGETILTADHSEAATTELDEITSYESEIEEEAKSSIERSTESRSMSVGTITNVKYFGTDPSEVLALKPERDNIFTSDPDSSESSVEQSTSSERKTSTTQSISEEISETTVTGSEYYSEESTIIPIENVTPESQKFSSDMSIIESKVSSVDFSSTTRKVISKDFEDESEQTEPKSNEEGSTEAYEYSTSSSDYVTLSTTIALENIQVDTSNELESSSELVITESYAEYEDISDKYEKASGENKTSISLNISSEQGTTESIAYSYNADSSKEDINLLGNEEYNETTESDKAIKKQSTKPIEELSTVSEEYGVGSTDISIGSSSQSQEYYEESNTEDSSSDEYNELGSGISTEHGTKSLTTEANIYDNSFGVSSEDEKTPEKTEDYISTSTTEYITTSDYYDEYFSILSKESSSEDINEEVTTESTPLSAGVSVMGLHEYSTRKMGPTKANDEENEESSTPVSYGYSTEKSSTTLSTGSIFESYFTVSDGYDDIGSTVNSVDETSKYYERQPVDISTKLTSSTLKSDEVTTNTYKETNELYFSDRPSYKSSEGNESISTEKSKIELEISEEVSSKELIVKLTTDGTRIGQTTSSTELLNTEEDSTEKNKKPSSERIPSEMSIESDEYEEAISEKQTVLPVEEISEVSSEYYDYITEKLLVDKDPKLTEEPSSYEYEAEPSGEKSVQKPSTISCESVGDISTKYTDELESSDRSSIATSEGMAPSEEEHDQDNGKINEIILKSSETDDGDQIITEKQVDSSEGNKPDSKEIESEENKDCKKKCPKVTAKFLEWLKSHYTEKDHEVSMPEEFQNIVWNDIFGENGDQVHCPYTTEKVLVLPNLDSCNHFYYCIKGVPYDQKCPDGLKFNALKMHCDFSHNVHCFS